jgi:hypothetical protein
VFMVAVVASMMDLRLPFHQHTAPPIGQHPVADR